MRRHNIPGFAVAIYALLSPSAGIRFEDGNDQHPLGGEDNTSDASLRGLPFSAEKLESYIQDVMDRWKAPGMAVAIVHGNETWAKGFGYASLPSIPVTPHTLFYTGSTTKSFTAAALSLLIDNSSTADSDTGTTKLSWTTPISQLLREDFVLRDDWATAHITLEDAASHRTGSAPHDLAFVTSSRDQVRRLRHLPLAAEPRQRFQYNNHMFTTLGYLVETLAGTWLGAFFRERLWAPMGMDETFLNRGDPRFKEVESNLVLADGYYWRNHSTSNGKGESKEDYAKYLRIMMHKEGPISAAGHRELRTPRTFFDVQGPPFTGPVTYTLAWMHGVFEGVETWHHTGTVNEFVTSMMMMPSREMGIVVMCNAASMAKDLVWYRIMYDLLGVEEGRRFDFEEERRRQQRHGRKMVDDGRKRLYPHVPNPPLLPSATLDKHAGRYYNPGYGEIIVDLVCDGGNNGGSSAPHIRESEPSARKGDDKCHLEAHLEDTSIFKFVFMLEHVSGDYWVGWVHVKGVTDPDEPMAAVRAQFRLNARGVVSEVGIDLRLEEGDEVPLTWFTRSC
ncbi:beta-lactamase/transpeptidase-like protein [Apiospora rasikravindrae]|uniref:Beta-lactamase/transpeptidase-like protein n=1 Tax=Apiospora rasikravindrae TaxID=990691 RepID=A0ABR1RNT9_9PEZI